MIAPDEVWDAFSAALRTNSSRSFQAQEMTRLMSLWKLREECVVCIVSEYSEDMTSKHFSLHYSRDP